MSKHLFITRNLIATLVVAMSVMSYAGQGKSKALIPPPVTAPKLEDSPEIGSHLGSQAAADLIRNFAQTDGAFLAAGLVKQDYSRDNLASLLQYQTDEIVIVTLTGAQIRQAFERSVSFFPQPNSSFLQVSGFEITFAKNPETSPRVLSVTAKGSKLEDTKSYTIAMPSSLGRGALGYFKIWDKSKITKTFEGKTAEDVLKGQKFFETSPRWQLQG